MKKILTTCCCLWLTSFATAIAQTSPQYTITGELTDSLTGTAEAYATLRILKEGKNQPIKVTTTNENGKFRLTLPNSGRYQIQFTAVGKKTLIREIHLSQNKSIHLGKLLFQNQSTELGAATVVAQRPVVKAEVDRISYSMKDDPEAQTNNLLDMLRKVPMVTVDGEDKIQVKGNSSFKIYVNGKPNSMMSNNPSLILKSFPASAVKKIEVITDPGAKYDAEGTAGILNIVTLENTQTSGYTFTPNIAISNTSFHTGAFGMVQLGKLMLSANYGYGRHDQPTGNNGSERVIFNDVVNHRLTNEGNSNSKGDFQFGSMEGSYEFNPHNLLSFSASLYGNTNKTRSKSSTVLKNIEDQHVYSYNSFEHTKYKSTYLNASVDFQHNFKKPEQFLTFSYRLSTNPNEQKNRSFYSDLNNVPTNLLLEDRYINPDNHSDEHTAQIDFTTPLGKNHNLSTGVKYIFRINKSNNIEMHRPTGSDNDFTFNNEASLRYKHRTNIGAAYTEYGLKLKDFSIRTGLRYEYSKVKVEYPDGKRDAFDSHFSDWVPNASIGYNLSPTQMFKLTYNLRIGRPSIYYLSPYVNRTDPQNISYGQPDLESETAHNFGIGYSNFTPKFSINADLSYGISNNRLTEYSFIKDGIRHTTFANMMHSKVTDLSIFLNWMITKSTNFNINADCSYSDLKVYQTGDHNHGFSSTIFSSLRQTLPWNLKISLHGGYFRNNVGLQRKSSDFHFYSMSLSRSFLADNALSVTLNAGNFFDPKRCSESFTESRDFRIRSYNNWDNLNISIGIRYRLGKLQAQVKKASRTIINSDIVNGGNSSNSNQQGGM